MPEALRKFLENLDSTNADLIWEYLDGNENAITEMITVIVDNDPELLTQL